jgi:pyruvate dehydrogenase E1 component alpha subunit/2-oxoisovalerate dehydrogenase E1 component alpha subunit
MGDVESASVEVWTDADEARATGLLQVLAPDGSVVGPAPSLAPELLRKLHRAMLCSRVLGEKMLRLQRQGHIAFFAESRGQEAAVIGAAAALEAQDFIVPAHREIGAALYRGLPLASVVAQLYGNAHDVGRGRQMPAHLAAPRALNFIPPSSCVATQLPHAAGLAWAAKMRKDPVVTLAYLGEGATSAEDFHSGVNFAAVYHVPAVFLCANNQWAISTPASRQTASRTFAIKALAYGMPGVRVDGNDLLAVYAAVSEAAARARAGGGPTLIEAVTYRMGAHSSSDDPHVYRSEADEAAWADKDPLRRLGAYLATMGVLDAAGVAAQRAEIEAEIAAAVAAEESVGPPPLRSLIENVYAKPSAALEEQLAELERVRAATGERARR